MAKREKPQYKVIFDRPPDPVKILLNLAIVSSHGDYEYIDIVDPETNTRQRFTPQDVERRLAQ